MNLKIVAIAGTVLGTTVGAAAGYFFAKKKLAEEFQEAMDYEIAQMKAFYNTQLKKDMLETKSLDVRTPKRPAGVDDSVVAEVLEIEQLENIARTLRYRPDNVVVEEAKSLRTPAEKLLKNVFEEAPAHEESPRPKKPYAISEEEFMEGELNYAQVDLIYYNGDDTLADEGDVPLDDVNRIVGRENLNGFDEDGELYVRNERLQIDYHVTRSTGKYAVEVLGQV